MNLKQIKHAGYQLGLEAELSTQMRSLEAHIKDRKYDGALQCVKNVGELVSELSFVTNPKLVPHDSQSLSNTD